MQLHLTAVQPGQEMVMDRLFQFFSYDMSELNGSMVGQDGRYPPPGELEQYASAPYSAYWITADGEIAGLAVVRQEEGLRYLRHFFLLRKFRRCGIGAWAARKIFYTCPGRWRVSTMDFNVPAIAFWEKVCGGITNGQYEKLRRADEKGPQYEFVI